MSLSELSDNARLDLIQRLDPGSVQQLVVFFDVPRYERDKWKAGYEAQSLLDWLVARNSFGRLAEALEKIDRSDLAKVLWVSTEASSAAASISEQKLSHYLTSRVRHWSQPRFRLDKRFVDLSLVSADGAQASLTNQRKFHSLAEVLDHVVNPVVVVRAPPGGGKTTLLGHHELTFAQTALADGTSMDTRRFAFYASLDQYKANDTPQDWLAARWKAANHGLAIFGQLATGRAFGVVVGRP